MNSKEAKYTQFSLCKEMLETADVFKRFNKLEAGRYTSSLSKDKKVFLTGEGSSRIFPAKRAIYTMLKTGTDLAVFTDGGTQALEYDLKNAAVFGMSNSGKTKELIRLFRKLKDEGNRSLYGITAHSSTPLEELSNGTFVLSCGNENAVAATKSVAEQALFYDALFTAYEGRSLNDLDAAGQAVTDALETPIDSAIVKKIAGAGTIYFAGRNNGVAEELTLKTNEITHKKSDFLEGTYAVHGIEEVMDSSDVVIVIDPFEEEEEKFEACLSGGVGLSIIAVSSRQTRFPTIKIPEAGFYQNYVELAAGWNILVETGLFLGINLDKAERARKVGNEFTG